MKGIHRTVGIDEAGRGPLAGPVAVGAVLVPKGFDWELIPGVADSKMLSEKKREEIFRRARQLHTEGQLTIAVALVSEKVIDRKGISHAIRVGVLRCLKKVQAEPNTVRVLLDGSLKAPSQYLDQQTIIKGDMTEKEIGLASICAKVTRDRKMLLLSKRYPEYGFEIHKGYGTALHRKNIKKHGLSDIHRTTFCKGCQ